VTARSFAGVHSNGSLLGTDQAGSVAFAIKVIALASKRSASLDHQLRSRQMLSILSEDRKRLVANSTGSNMIVRTTRGS